MSGYQNSEWQVFPGGSCIAHGHLPAAFKLGGAESKYPRILNVGHCLKCTTQTHPQLKHIKHTHYYKKYIKLLLIMWRENS